MAVMITMMFDVSFWTFRIQVSQMTLRLHATRFVLEHENEQKFASAGDTAETAYTAPDPLAGLTEFYGEENGDLI